MLRALKADVVEKTFTNWVKDVCKSRPDLEGCLNAVAIDGPTMYASKKLGATISHLLSVVSHELGVTRTQQGVSGKTNEIPISTEILKNFDVSGKVITTDALLTQKTSCYALIEGNGDYMLSVKNNQPDTFTMISKNAFKAFLIHFLRTQHILYWETLFTRTSLMRNHRGDYRQGVSKQAQVSMRI